MTERQAEVRDAGSTGMRDCRNLVELFERSRRAFARQRLFGVKTAGGWEWSSYERVGEIVDDCRAGLAKLGVRRGDRVAIVADNRIEWAVACYASFGLGAVFVSMYRAQLAQEWRFILGDCGAKVAIGSSPEVVDALRAIQRELPSLEHVIALDAGSDDDRSFAALLSAGSAAPLAPIDPFPGDTADLIYTSGTTGLPKGVILSHGNVISNINAIQELLPFGPNDCSLAFLPWAHAFGQVCELHALISRGSALAINDAVAHLVANLAEVRPTVLYAVPRVFNRIYAGVHKQIGERPAPLQGVFHRGIEIAKRRARGEPIGIADAALLWLADRFIFSTVRRRFGGRLRYALSGSAALNHEVAEFIDALGVMVYEGYGLTETSPIVSANYPGHRKMGSVGKPIPGVTVRIDRTVGDDPVQGEILVYGPNVMQGYYNRPEETRAVMMDDGGLRTGDLGHLDGDGYLYITGRIKEQYKLENGKYVVPSPLEETLKLSPFIANAFVTGENKPYNVALVVPDTENFRAWAEASGSSLDDMAHDPRVHALLRSEIDRLSEDWKGYERIGRFVVSPDDFTIENGLLTPSLKLKRRAVMARHAATLAALYQRAPDPTAEASAPQAGP